MSCRKCFLLGSKQQVNMEEDPYGQPPMKQIKLEQAPVSRLTMDDIPDEIIVRILSYCSLEELMYIIQYVCRRLNILSRDPELWRNKVFCVGTSCPDKEAISELRQMPQLRALKFEKTVMPDVIPALCESCNRLTTLEFADTQQMTPSLLKMLVVNCRHIQSLTIPAEFLVDECDAMTVAQLRKLQSLALDGWTAPNSFIHLSSFADGCPDLVRLKVGERVNTFKPDLEYFFGIQGKKLTHVSMPWASYNGRCVAPLLRECTSLTHLQLSRCGVRCDEAFTVLGHLSTLRSLKLSLQEQYHNGPAVHAFESGSLSSLQVLDLSDSKLQDSVVVAVCYGCQELKELYLRSCYYLSDEAFRHIRHLAKLEVLDLDNCQRLRGQALLHVAQVRKLRTLVLDGLSHCNLQPGLDSVLQMTSLETLSLVNGIDIAYFPLYKLRPGCRLNTRRMRQ